MSVKALTIITAALRKLGVEAQGEAVSADNGQFMLGELNRMVNAWCARNLMLYSRGFSKYTLIVNHSPHTIGPTGTAPDFTCAVGRPVEIVSASLVLTSSTPNLDIPLRIRDDDWWASVTLKSLTSTLPTDLYYSPDFPKGSLYFWPVANSVNDVRLETRSLVSQFADLVTDYDLPFGYEDALVCSLAEIALVSYPRPETQGLIIEQARNARAVIASVNARSPNISTEIGGSGRRGSSWSFLTGGYRP
jgi:hypothetical protein